MILESGSAQLISHVRVPVVRPSIVPDMAMVFRSHFLMDAHNLIDCLIVRFLGHYVATSK